MFISSSPASIIYIYIYDPTSGLYAGRVWATAHSSIRGFCECVRSLVPYLKPCLYSPCASNVVCWKVALEVLSVTDHKM